MKLKRSLIKSQAKQLIKGNVFKLFIIAFVVTALTGLGTSISGSASGFNFVKDYFDNSDSTSSYSDAGDALENFDNFTGEAEGNIEDFDFGNYLEEYGKSKSAAKPRISFGGGFTGIIAIFLAPLSVSLAGLFLMLIRGRNLKCGEGFTYVFKSAFDSNYIKRVLTLFLAGIFTFLWSLLFIIPGIVYSYKIRFLPYILSEHPDMEWKEAIELSKKMTNGHKGELFVLDLSYFPWYLLGVITLSLINIYFIPYTQTVEALYYENFKQRGLQSGELSAEDFISNQQKMMQGGFAAAPIQPQYQPPVQPQYQPPVQPQYQAPVQPEYQAPVQPQYQAPVQPEYQPPVQTPEQQPVQNDSDVYYQPPQENE
jgi:hypothetical protein